MVSTVKLKFHDSKDRYHGHAYVDLSDTVATACSHSHRRRSQVACAAVAATARSRHSPAGIAALELLPIVAAHSRQAVSASFTNVADETVAEFIGVGNLTLPETDSVGIFHSIRMQTTVAVWQQCRRFSLVCGAGGHIPGGRMTCVDVLGTHVPKYEVSYTASFDKHNARFFRKVIGHEPGRPSLNPQIHVLREDGFQDKQTIEQLWELYLPDSSQWWDNTVDKRNPGSPDLKHKVRRISLWTDGWSTPAWVKASVKSVTQGKVVLVMAPEIATRLYRKKVWVLPNFVIEPPKGNIGKENTCSTSAGGLWQIVGGSGGSMHLQCARTTSEAITILKNHPQQGIIRELDMYIEVLKRCLKQKDLIATEQVQDCMHHQSGMDQNT